MMRYDTQEGIEEREREKVGKRRRERREERNLGNLLLWGPNRVIDGRNFKFLT